MIVLLRGALIFIPVAIRGVRHIITKRRRSQDHEKSDQQIRTKITRAPPELLLPPTTTTPFALQVHHHNRSIPYLSQLPHLWLWALLLFSGWRAVSRASSSTRVKSVPSSSPPPSPPLEPTITRKPRRQRSFEIEALEALALLKKAMNGKGANDDEAPSPAGVEDAATLDGGGLRRKGSYKDMLLLHEAMLRHDPKMKYKDMVEMNSDDASSKKGGGGGGGGGGGIEDFGQSLSIFDKELSEFETDLKRFGTKLKQFESDVDIAARRRSY